LIPLAAISGGTARVAAFLLAMTSRENGLVLVDEVDSGIYHARQKRVAQALLALSAAYGTQLVLTTHSEEFLSKFLDVIGESDEVAFWRLERDRNLNPVMKRFTPDEFRSGMSIGEMR
jgi:AAA15 family ATPase/GTPase